MNAQSLEHYYSTAEVAEMVGISAATVLRAAARGELRSIRLGYRRRYSGSAGGMSITKRGEGAYCVRVAPFRAQTLRTRADAERVELELKRRKSLGELYEAPAETLGAAVDGTLARLKATRSPSESWMKLCLLAAKAWEPLRGTRVSALRRVVVEDMTQRRAERYPKSAKNELEFLKRVLRESKGRGQRVDPAIFEIPAVKHKPRRGRALTVPQLYEFASWFPEHVVRLILLAGMVGARQRCGFA